MFKKITTSVAGLAAGIALAISMVLASFGGVAVELADDEKPDPVKPRMIWIGGAEPPPS